MIRGKMTKLSSLFVLLSAVSISFTSGAENVEPLLCQQEGVFPVPDSCREYYECYSWRGLLYLQPKECPSDTIFDADLSECRLISLTNPSPCAVDTSEEITTVVPHVETVTNEQSTLIITPNNVPLGDNNNDTVQNTTVNQASDFAAVSKNGNATLDVEFEETGVPESSFSNRTVIVTDVTLEKTDDLNTTHTMAVATTTTPAPVILTLCDHLNFVSSHATLVIATPLYRQSLAYEKKFNEIVQIYNAILENVKNNSLVWENGDSIMAGIKKAVQLASEYKREFSRKYDIYKKIIPKQSSDKGITLKLQEDIRLLQEDIKNSEDALAMTYVPTVRRFLENNIRSKQQEIDRKKEEIELSSSEAQQLAEILHFLQYVKTDADAVENFGTHLITRINTLLNQYKSDISTLQNVIIQVNASINFVTNEAETTNIQNADNAHRQQGLEQQKVNLDDEISRLNGEIRAKMRSINELQRTADKKNEAFKKKVARTCDPTRGAMKQMLEDIRNPTEKDKEAACETLLEAKNVKLDIKHELDQMKKLSQENEGHRDIIKESISAIDNANRELTQLLNEAPHHKSKLRQISAETGNLQLLQRDLLAHFASANDAVTSLAFVDETVQEVNSNFEALSKQLNIMIAQVPSAKTDEERLQVKTAIEEAVSEILPKLHQMELPVLELCT